MSSFGWTPSGLDPWKPFSGSPLLRVEKPLILALLGEGSMSPGLEVIVPWVDIVDGTVYITLRMEDDVVR